MIDGAQLQTTDLPNDDAPASPLTIDERMALPPARNKQSGVDRRPRKGIAVAGQPTS